MNSIDNLLAGLVFSQAPVERENAKGRKCQVHVAPANGTFWSAWRADREALIRQGIFCGKSPDGAWEVWRNSVQPPAIHPAQKAQPARIALVAMAEACGNLSQPLPAAIPAVRNALGSKRSIDQTIKAIREADAATVRWSEEQLVILAYAKIGKGNGAVMARAGCGKTFTITGIVRYASEEDILYLVFAKKNQREACAKITDPRCDSRTANSLGYRFVRSVWRDAHPDDSVEWDRIMALEPNIPDVVARAIEKLVGFAKNTLIQPTQQALLEIAEDRDIYEDGFETRLDEHGREVPDWTQARLASYAMRAMEAAKIKDPQGRISFNDQVWLAVAMNWVRPRYDLVIADESQDLNLPQIVLMQRVCRKGGRIIVVGDDRQAIYEWRGSMQGAMAYLKRQLGASEFGLTVTRRCPKVVVARACQLVPDYKAHPDAPEGLIQDIGENKMIEMARPGDFILSRINAPLMGLCLMFLKRGTPARIEGRDVGAQLLNTVRSMNARSIPDFLSKVERWRIKAVKRASKAKRNAESKIENANDTANMLIAVAEGLASVREIEDRVIALFSDTKEGSKPAVVLSSVHRAKGLEADRVFLLEWTFKVKEPYTAVTEAANIRYVAITRSKRELYLVGGAVAQPAPAPNGIAALDKAIQDIGDKHNPNPAIAGAI